MPRIFEVQIDLDRLRTNLSQQEGRALEPAEVSRWLQEAGFTPLGEGWWRVAEPDLGQLEPAEVTAARVVGEEEDAGPLED